MEELIKQFLSVSSGYGDGYGSGDGDGDGDGSGSGYGSGYGIISFNGKPVYVIDNLMTVIEKVKGNLAIGFVINNDLTTRNCYIVKGHNLFAHGDTLKKAEAALQEKIFDTMDTEEKITAFLERFDLDVKYPAKDFYEWHHKLTGSCEFGRNAFCKNHDIDLENGLYTVQEFIEITRNDYGSSIIEQLAERIEE